MRLAKYLASCGLGSRRDCEKLIEQGRVSVNGQTALTPATNIDQAVDKVTFDGVVVAPKGKIYYAVNKPAGYTSSRDDKHADRLVTRLVPNDPPVWPVGRLDRDTSGLILLTNDGELTQRLTHPSYGKEKEYLLTTDTAFSNDELSEARAGVVLEDGLLKPDFIEPAGGKNYRVVIHEGRKRVVRRFAAYFGKSVRRLERIRIAGLKLDDLEEGDYRSLTAEETSSLLS
ncbi:MAG: pseudouridine synthase [Actinomycetota bacterium]